MVAFAESRIWQGSGGDVADSPLRHFSTDMFAPQERASAWREAYGQSIAQLDLNPSSEGPFKAEATLCSLPGLTVVETETGRMSWRCQIHSDDVVLVTSETGAWTCTERGQDITLTAGQATFCHNGATTMGTTIGRRSMVRVPIKSIAPLVGEVTAKLERKFELDATLLGLLSPNVGLVRRGAVSAELQRTVVAHVHDLFAMLIGPTRDGAEFAGQRGLRAARLKAIKDDIAKSLSDEGLSVGTIAVRHKVTPRYIQILFEDEGVTFTEYVLGERLARAHRMLISPRCAGQKISAIAYDAGFGDLSYFIRAFGRRYGALPSDVRAQARQSPKGAH